MSATTLLAMQRLEALGANALYTSLNDPRRARAEMLVDMAAEQVLAYINLDDDGIAALTVQLQGIVATAVAEAASSRLQYPAAPSSDGFIMPDGMVSIMLPRRVKRLLDDHFRPANAGSISLVVERDEDSSYFRPFIPLDLWL